MENMAHQVQEVSVGIQVLLDKEGNQGLEELKDCRV